MDKEWAKAHFFIARDKMPVVVNKELEEKLIELGGEVALGSGIEVVEVQVRGAGKARLVRIYIDKPGGVSHGDCEFISQGLGDRLDALDLIPEDHYTLEVSSLGVERKLSKPKDFERVIGQKVLVSIKDAQPGAHQVEGKLLAVADDSLHLETGSAEHVRIPLDQVQRAKLRFDW